MMMMIISKDFEKRIINGRNQIGREEVTTEKKNPTRLFF
jgi:hypothetical protein